MMATSHTQSRNYMATITHNYNKHDKDLAEVVDYNNKVAANPLAGTLGLKQVIGLIPTWLFLPPKI